MIQIAIILFFCFLFWSYLLKSNKLNKIDSYIYQKIKITSKKTLILKIITNLASTKFFVIVCLCLLIFLENKTLALIITILLIIDSLIVSSFKHIFKRKRPNILRLVEEKGYSYPSGHSTTSTVFYFFLIYLTILNPLAIYIKLIIIITLILLVLIICFSRIYLGVHYFSDVIAGFLVGSSYLLIYVYFVSHYLNLLCDFLL